MRANRAPPTSFLLDSDSCRTLTARRWAGNKWSIVCLKEVRVRYHIRGYANSTASVYRSHHCTWAGWLYVSINYACPTFALVSG
jgi:hypothetical protein